MSKSFPGTARKYDLYIGSPEPFQIGRVLFDRGRRFVIRAEFSRAAWDLERDILPEKPAWQGMRLVGDNPFDEETFDVASNEVPVDLAYFYGADFI